MFRKEFMLKNGKNLIVREAEYIDAEEITNMQNIIQDETNYFAFSTAEKVVTVEETKEKIASFLANKNSRYLLAIIDNKIVGYLTLKQKSKHLRISHRCEFSVGVLKEYWGAGIGKKLMECMIDSAKEIGYEQIELIVVSENERAHKLYQSFGFVDEGVIKNGLKLQDGTYLDEFMMVKFL